MTRSWNCCVFPSISIDRDRDNRPDEKIERNRHNRTTTPIPGAEYGTRPVPMGDATATRTRGSVFVGWPSPTATAYSRWAKPALRGEVETYAVHSAFSRAGPAEASLHGGLRPPG